MQMKKETERRREKILYQEPFRKQMRIKEIESLLSSSAWSGTAYKVTAKDGKKYKLRYFKRLRTAWSIEKSAREHPDVFPKFYGREGRYLLFEWIEGPELSKLSLKTCKELGRICGEVHEVAEELPASKGRKIFAGYVKKLKPFLDKKTLDKLMELYDEKISKIDCVVVKEISDMHSGNFKYNPKTKRLVMIDDEGITHRIKGVGMYKAFIKWMKAKEKKAFLEGYNETHSSEYVTDEYHDFLTFWVIVKDLQNKSIMGVDHTKQLNAFNEYMSKQKI
ncbi:hypothetical protein HQ545_05605 [Candidatus Woesearchaeota archaeon]|nr:hypothetical protein [Candidatus Woesearchaeota archaeon]